MSILSLSNLDLICYHPLGFMIGSLFYRARAVKSVKLNRLVVVLTTVVVTWGTVTAIASLMLTAQQA